MRLTQARLIHLFAVALTACSPSIHSVDAAHVPAGVSPPAPSGASSASKAEAPPPAAAEPSPSELVEETERSRVLTRSAMLLAGLPVEGDGVWLDVQNQGWWKAHSKDMAAAWHRHERDRLAAIRQWSETALGEVRKSARVVFYPFGGPDSLYPTAFFPDARSYVLVGLEPVGAAPELPSAPRTELARSFKRLTAAIVPMLRLSFFRTQDIQSRLADQGVLPILLVLLARSGYRIHDVELIGMQPDGTAAPWTRSRESRDEPQGARITILRQGERQPRFLFYFQQNLSDDAMAANPELSIVLRTLEPPVTLLKAASYLLHRGHFSAIRRLILERSAAVLEDDSGIPFRHFDPGQWEVRLYGRYTAPIQVFAHWQQKDLVEAYQSQGASLLEFGLGYKYKLRESNLLLAVKRGR